MKVRDCDGSRTPTSHLYDSTSQSKASSFVACAGIAKVTVAPTLSFTTQAQLSYGYCIPVVVMVCVNQGLDAQLQPLLRLDFGSRTVVKNQMR